MTQVVSPLTGFVVYSFQVVLQIFWQYSPDMRAERQSNEAGQASQWEGADPTFLNYYAWQFRWSSYRKAEDMALSVLEYSRTPGLGRPNGTRRRNGLAFRTLGWLALWRGDFQAAEAYSHKAIARLKGVGAESALVDAHDVLAVVGISRNDLAVADAHIKEAKSLLPKSKNADTETGVLITESIFERLSGRLVVAQNISNEVMKMSVGETRARAKLNMARALYSVGDYAQAEEHISCATTLCSDQNNAILTPYVIEVYAQIQIAMGQTDGVAQKLDHATDLANDRMDTRAVAHILRQRAELEYSEGRVSTALETFLKALEISKDLDYGLLQTLILRRCAELQEGLGHTADALASMKSLDQLNADYATPAI